MKDLTLRILSLRLSVFYFVLFSYYTDHVSTKPNHNLIKDISNDLMIAFKDQKYVIREIPIIHKNCRSSGENDIKIYDNESVNINFKIKVFSLF